MADKKSEIKSHRDLIAWQRAMDLVVETYIAEGQGRRLSGEFIHFLGNARG
ncbi:MAG: hypothetical protein J2P52_10900 [Blastocatellia bacterium]|nr:hypothetical protein [Blastocatellia bacterium]